MCSSVVETNEMLLTQTGKKNNFRLHLFSHSFPEEGQYGLDIYTREVGSHSHHNNHSSSEKHLLTHCCKYLINSSKRN